MGTHPNSQLPTFFRWEIIISRMRPGRCRQEGAVVGVQQDEGEDAIQRVNELLAMLLVLNSNDHQFS
jgi:hypothetical protein